jgi:protein-S-isoprenylcysteine O-methyltransferase Ste14
MVTGQAQPTLNRSIWARALIAPVIILALVFVPAGRLDYWQGWLYVALSVASLGATWAVMRDNPELVAERLRPGQGMQLWDKWYFALSTPLYLATLVVAGLDAGRWGWSPPLATWVYALGVAAFVLGQALFLWAKATNRYFSSVVRIQAERGQTVCREGPYAAVRHPGYVGGLLYGVATAVVLGSLWALLPATLAAAMLVVRTALEDRLLRRELPGYAAYARDVRYRLLPGIW